MDLIIIHNKLITEDWFQCFDNAGMVSSRASRVMRYWHGYLSGAKCKWFAYGPADASATPIISCFIKIQNG